MSVAIIYSGYWPITKLTDLHEKAAICFCHNAAYRGNYNRVSWFLRTIEAIGKFVKHTFVLWLSKTGFLSFYDA